jgi:purine-binding chemotaxis protein CheW
MSDMQAAIPAELEQARYIVYSVGAERFASSLLSIKEIVDPLPYCRVPNDHAYFLGLANLRGQIIGVIDLGLRLGLHSSVSEDGGVLLILEEDGIFLGALVSRVESAITVDSLDIREDHNVHGHGPQEAYPGVVRHDDKILPIISLARLFQEPEGGSKAA